MTLVFAPRAFVHDDRYGSVRDTSLLRLVVLHTTEGGEGLDSAEQLAQFVGRPKTVDPTTGKTINQASYHYVLDTNQVIPLVPENVVAYSAPGANNDGIHVVFPGRVAQTREQWLDPVSSAYIDRAAELILNIADRRNLPLTRLTDVRIKAGDKGYCDHWAVCRVYNRCDHTDVGTNFPWDVLAERIRALLTPPTPPQEDDMAITLYIVQPTPDFDPQGAVLGGYTVGDDVALQVQHVDEVTFNAMARPQANGGHDPIDGVKVTKAFTASAFRTTMLLGALPPGWHKDQFAQAPNA